MKRAYLALDAHARSCTLGCMDEEGQYVEEWTFPTAESELIRHVARINARQKLLTFEEGPLAFWLARTLRDQVDRVCICDPTENPLISRAARKNDRIDVYRLCRLLRLDELKAIYHPREDHRAVFKAAVDEYIDLRRQQTALKSKIKAKYRSWGVFNVEGTRPYSKEGRVMYLSQLQHEAITEQLRRLYAVLDTTVDAWDEAREAMLHLGRRYREIREFRKMPGVGPVISHIFDAYIQTPHRFATKQKLWRYCKLGVTERSSGGKRLAHKRLDRSGNGELKSASYHAWMAAMREKKPNEVQRFFEASLERTGNRTHARLNTQRKILAVLWTIWRKNAKYRSDKFLGSGGS